LTYNLSESQPHTLGLNQAIINNAPAVIEVVKASRKKNTVIQRKIPAERTRKGLLLGVPKHVEAVTDIHSIEHARAHVLEKVDNNKRRECIDCKIRGRPSRPGGKYLPRERSVLKDITNKEANKKVKYTAKALGKCTQCNMHLCIHGECWDIYYRAKRFS
jgi:hypothetical protein